MKKYLHSFLLVFLNVFFCLLTVAQTNRIAPEIKSQKIEITPSSVVNNNHNVSEKKASEVLKPTFNKTDSIKPNVTVISSVNMRSKFETTKDKNEDETQIIKNKEEIEVAVQRQTAPSIDTPLYPDFKVEAIKETPYENEFISKEKQSEKLVKLERVASDVQIENVVSDAPAKITISPSKRKYLEVVLKDLEKELQQNPNTDRIDMQVKKKELEDLKKLLQQ
jgi:hypothetical protein